MNRPPFSADYSSEQQYDMPNMDNGIQRRSFPRSKRSQASRGSASRRNGYESNDKQPMHSRSSDATGNIRVQSSEGHEEWATASESSDIAEIPKRNESKDME